MLGLSCDYLPVVMPNASTTYMLCRTLSHHTPGGDCSVEQALA